MISLVLTDSQKEEKNNIEKEIRSLTAKKTDEKLVVIKPEKLEDVEELKKKYDLVHMSVMDVVMKKGIPAAESLRRQYPLSEMMIIADMTISPIKYMIPSIRASSLLLRPFSEEQFQSICEQFYVSSIKNLNIKQNETMFLIKNNDGRTLIPYEDIYYFEAVNKKITVRTKQEEYEIYDTIEKLLETLPNNFMRCHRSFIINKTLIKNVRLSDGIIQLYGSVTVPLSRSYKKAVKEYMDGRKSL